MPGDGDPNAELMFIGEGPGFHEDRQGRPFVGRAGQLLDDLLSGIGLTRADVFVTNVLKCRPPNNRDPEVDEIAACEPFLATQIAGIRPKLIVPLGRFAMQHFLPGAAISRAHGTPVYAGRFLVYPVYHPAAALRQGTLLQVLRDDFAAIPELLTSAERPDLAVLAPTGASEQDESGSGTQLSLL